jgi:hypothetical protein
VTDALTLYLTWRAAQSPADQERLDYLVVDALPLLADVIKEYVDPSIRQIAVVGGIADSIFDSGLDGAVAKAIPALVPKTGV